MIMSILSNSALAIAVSVLVSLPANGLSNRGCQPKHDPEGCAGRGAPLVIANKQAYLIVAKGHIAGAGSFGWSDASIQVNDLTSMRPQDKKSAEFSVAVTYVNSEFAYRGSGRVEPTETNKERPVNRGGSRRQYV
jgi:hypothetical protein